MPDYYCIRDGVAIAHPDEPLYVRLCEVVQRVLRYARDTLSWQLLHRCTCSVYCALQIRGGPLSVADYMQVGGGQAAGVDELLRCQCCISNAPSSTQPVQRVHCIAAQPCSQSRLHAVHVLVALCVYIWRSVW
jgi:hypothetical protein